jgi:polysaccharide export outer membrane protein
MTYTVDTDAGKFSQPTSFSDEVSRDLVRQTQKMLELQRRDYLVGPDDVLEISVFEWGMGDRDSKALEFRVAESGIISLPSIGELPVAGKTVQDIQKLIEKTFTDKNVLQNPRVGVSVKEFRSRTIAVIGAVNAPGVYAIHQNVTTFMDMLTLAGGPNTDAGQVAYVLRKQQQGTDPVQMVIDLQELFEKGQFALNAVLQGDDVVYVPTAPLVYVYGAVRNPGGFPLNRSMRATEAVAVAGGFTQRASKSGCYIMRKTSRGNDTALSLDFPEIEDGKAPNVYLRDGDVLNVPESAGLIAVNVLWEVFRGIFTFTYDLNAKE